MGMVLYVGSIAAGTYDQLWDYRTAPPTANPDRGLSYSSTVNDGEGVKNGLKGIKLNSSGWCSFVEGSFAEPAPCAPLENPVPLYSAGMRTDSMDANAAFFIRALMNANAGGEKMIRLPDGIYDLGPLALTTTTILNNINF